MQDCAVGVYSDRTSALAVADSSIAARSAGDLHVRVDPTTPDPALSPSWSTTPPADLPAGKVAAAGGSIYTRSVGPSVLLGGGSREQKDIFRDVFVELHRRLGRAADVITLAQRRLLANPSHLPSLAALAWAYERTGEGALQRQACRQLVRRAEELGCAIDTPEVASARMVLAAIPV